MPTHCSGVELDIYDTLGWSLRTSQLSDLRPETCRLQWLRDTYKLPRDIDLNLAKLISSGLCLKAQFASRSSETKALRLYFGPRRTLDSTASFATIACSHLGRNFQHLPTWPRLLDAALRAICRDKKTLLIGTGSTLSKPALEFASGAGIDYCLLEFPKSTFENWIRKIVCASVPEPEKQTVSVSPPLNSVASDNEQPVQDSVSIGIADRVYCLSIREGGRLSSILTQKIENTKESATPSVFVFLDTPDTRSSDYKYHQGWLDRGAIGWWVPEDSDGSSSRRCLDDVQSNMLPFIQITCPYHLLARNNQEDFLVHCTRAGSGHLPDESTSTFHRRAWIEGKTSRTAIETLEEICSTGKLLGSSALIRTSDTAVSFSAVPLDELLRRRTFRSHLGRWDWEPYGIMIQRNTLEQLGARPVIYGTSSDFDDLDHLDKPFFQSAGNSGQWQSEKEWRLLSSLDLRSLPPNAVRVFAENARSARRIAKKSSWPVFWIENTAN